MSTRARTNNLDRSPVHLLHRASQCAGEIFQTEIIDHDLTPRQLAVLVTVAYNEGLSQTDLVELTGIDRSTVTDLVWRMQKKGLLQRRRTREDTRAYAVKLTEEGQRVLAKVEPLAKRADDHLLAALPAGQRDQFVERLVVLVEKLQSMADARRGAK